MAQFQIQFFLLVDSYCITEWCSLFQTGLLKAQYKINDDYFDGVQWVLWVSQGLRSLVVLFMSDSLFFLLFLFCQLFQSTSRKSSSVFSHSSSPIKSPATSVEEEVRTSHSPSHKSLLTGYKMLYKAEVSVLPKH